MNNSVIFGSFLATSLLALYVLSIVKAVMLTLDPGISADAIKSFNEGSYPYIMNLIGGLISAAVVSALAVTDPKDLPGVRALSLKDWKAYLPSIYIAVWIICGLAAVYCGMLEYKNEVASLSAQGKTWLGTAVAAVYAYFGVSPNNNGQSGNPTKGE